MHYEVEDFDPDDAPEVACFHVSIARADEDEPHDRGFPALVFQFGVAGHDRHEGFRIPWCGQTPGEWAGLVHQIQHAVVDLVRLGMDDHSGCCIDDDGNLRPVDEHDPDGTIAPPARTRPRCPGCGAALFGPVAERGACLSCFPEVPEGEVTL